jgi:hypothetical protein
MAGEVEPWKRRMVRFYSGVGTLFYVDGSGNGVFTGGCFATAYPDHPTRGSRTTSDSSTLASTSYCR